MASGYLPQPLPDFLLWTTNFAALITANPALYGLVAGDATTIQTSADDFATAYGISTAPATRTPVTVEATITARNTLVQIVRGYARIILANAGVADSDKLALGLRLRDTVNTPIPVPLTNPVIEILGATPGQITCRYHDSAQSALIKSKPFGAIQMQLFITFGTVAPVTPSAAPFYGVVTKAPFIINCPNGSAGQTAYIYGRWVTQKGLVGPYSPLAQAAIM